MNNNPPTATGDGDTTVTPVGDASGSQARLPHRTPGHDFAVPVRTARPSPGPETLQRVLDGLHQL
jgi:hypothetical protein